MVQKIMIFLFFMVLIIPGIAFATEFTSDSFKVVDPVINTGGIIGATSDTFKVSGGLGQVGVGTSSSASFDLKSGFFYFPVEAATSTTFNFTTGGSNYSAYLESLVKLGIFPLLPTEAKPCGIAFDLNCDGSVGLKDFSIFLAVQNRPIPNTADFNKDSKIDFKDLSILLSGWTGKLLSFSEPAPGAFLAGTAKVPFRGEAAIFSLREISRRETVFKPIPMVTGKSGFFKTAVQFISNVFNRVIKIFIR